MVYVDTLFYWPAVRHPLLKSAGSIWCHLTADSELELVNFAKKLGRQSVWLQKSGTPRFHFDLCPNERNRAVELGAVPISRRQMIELMKRRGRSKINSVAIHSVLSGD